MGSERVFGHSVDRIVVPESAAADSPTKESSTTPEPRRPSLGSSSGEPYLAQGDLGSRHGRDAHGVARFLVRGRMGPRYRLGPATKQLGTSPVPRHACLQENCVKLFRGGPLVRARR